MRLGITTLYKPSVFGLFTFDGKGFGFVASVGSFIGDDPQAHTRENPSKISKHLINRFRLKDLKESKIPPLK